MTVIIVIYAVSFTAFHLACMIGLIIEYLNERRNLDQSPDSNSQPLVSIIVPAKNEAANLGKLLTSLAVQDYPKLEFIFIDDRSSDDTAAKFEAFAADCPHKVQLLSLKDNPGPNFKQFALTQAILIARGEYFLFTDADCVVGPHWASVMAARLADDHNGLVIGPVFKQIIGKGFFQFYQAFDHAVRYMYLSATAGLGQACGGFGNNLIVKRRALEAIGGYEAVPYSPTEDAALIALIRSGSKLQIRSALLRDSFVITQPVANWQELITQGLRWNNGGLFAPDLKTRIGFGALMGAISLGILTIPLAVFLPAYLPLPLTVFFSMAMNTIAVSLITRDSLPRLSWRFVIPAVFTPFYFTFLTILGLLGIKPKWKNETLK